MAKKSQANPIAVWIMVLVFIFITAAVYFATTKGFIALSDYATPKIDFTGTGNHDHAIEVLHKVTNYWIAFPVVFIMSLIGYAIWTSLKQDPNYPYR